MSEGRSSVADASPHPSASSQALWRAFLQTRVVAWAVAALLVGALVASAPGKAAAAEPAAEPMPPKAAELIKVIGKELVADPEFAPNILGPLKMQGIEQFADYGIQIRLKMTTRPDEQFAIRRKA